MSGVLQDVRYAFRVLRQRPLFALVAVVSIGIGVGATTTVFSVANALLLERPAGIARAERVVEVGRSRGGQGFDTFSYPELLDLQERTRTLGVVAGWRLAALSFSGGGESERVMGMAASADYFAVAGVRPQLGRFYGRDEDRAIGAHPVVVLSHGFWQERLGGDAGIVGRSIDLDRRRFTVVGVTPAEFRGHMPAVEPAVYIPLTMWGITRPGFSGWDERFSSWLMAVGRLAEGASLEQANAELGALFRSLPQPNDDPRNHRSASVQQLGTVPAAARTPATAFLAVLLGLVGFVLLITCANVAGMLIARAAGREREMAIRLAIGSSRRAIVRQLLIESVVLFGFGGVAGVLLARWSAAALSAVQLPTPIPVELDFTADVRVLGAGLALALFTGLIFGLAPALQASRPSLLSGLKAEHAQRGSRGGRMRRMFVMAQVALSLALLASAGLFLRSLQRAASMDAGFNARGVHMVSFDLAMDGYDESGGRAFQQRLLERAGQLSGVSAVGYADDLPLDLGISETVVTPEGWQSGPEDGSRFSTAFATVGGEYFRALEIALLAGRVFGPQDDERLPRVAVISAEFARRAWPDQDPVGKRIRSGAEDDGMLVIGVVADVKNQTLMETQAPMLYTPVTQEYRAAMTLLVRGSGAVTAESIRAAIRELDPRLSTSLLQRLDRYTAIGVLPQRIAAAIATCLGLLALLLSALGVYGVIAFLVAQRTREIGTRIALGAVRADVVRLVLRDGLSLTLPGLLVGMLAALLIGRVVRTFILGVAATDPATFVVVPLVMLCAIALACFAPARRAAGVEPIVALRSD